MQEVVANITGGVRMGSDAHGRVRLAEKTMPLAALREHATDYARLFARAKAEVGHAECLCRTPALRLVIRCSRAGRFHLAGWPGDGERHAADCAFHKLAPGLSGREGYSTEAIRESEHGIAIRFDTAMARRLSEPEPGKSPHTEHSEGRIRKTVGLLGLLHWLWEEAQLTAWHPRWRRRTWGICHSRLTQQIAGCSINQEDLAETMYVVPPYRPSDAARTAEAFELFRARLGRHGDTERRGLILGQIKAVSTTPYGVRYTLVHHRGALFATAALDERIRRSYRTVFSEAAANLEAPQIGLFVVELSPKGYLTVVDMAAMLVSRLYIPADSSHEIVMADALADHGRAYVKPVRYDGTDAVFPDFILTDTHPHPHQYVEVYGIRGRESYDKRKAVKQAYYQRQGARLIEWEVTDPLPDLSAPAHSRLERWARTG